MNASPEDSGKRQVITAHLGLLGEGRRGTDGGFGSPGCVGSMFDERCDDELVALAGSNMKGRVSVLVLTINVSSCRHNDMQGHIVSSG